MQSVEILKHLFKLSVQRSVFVVKNGSKILFWRAGLMPGPLSAKVIITDLGDWHNSVFTLISGVGLADSGVGVAPAQKTTLKLKQIQDKTFK